MTQAKTEPRQETIDQIADEHEALERALDQLVRTTDPQLLIPRLEKLRGQLEHHFATEETVEGFRSDLEANAPYLLGPLDQIFDEHKEFLNDVEALRTQARALVDGPLAELRDGISSLARRLHDH
jgi:iron-sulfur cluster repair protein YtfE (RIC family)